MRERAFFTISLAFACCALICPRGAQAQAMQNPQSADDSVNSSAAQSVAAQMVPAEVVLEKDLDARKVQPGQQFRATLTGTVHLKNGTELPRGTQIEGTIATDSTQSNRGLTLALRFTQADLKDGKAIPIRAMSVGVAPPEYSSAWDGSDAQAPPDPWNGTALEVDDVGVMSGIDLHSRVAGENSGVFVSQKKNDMKLQAKSQMSLAIAPQGSSESGL
jgi:hypothetical protein